MSLQEAIDEYWAVIEGTDGKVPPADTTEINAEQSERLSTEALDIIRGEVAFPDDEKERRLRAITQKLKTECAQWVASLPSGQ